VRQAILRVIQESFTNALKHGKATQLHLELIYSERMLQLLVRNNGAPIDDLKYGFGLTTMKHRVERFGGILLVSSSGKGTAAITEVRCDIPLKEGMRHDED
jgi:signal transduction histidine kinase